MLGTQAIHIYQVWSPEITCEGTSILESLKKKHMIGRTPVLKEKSDKLRKEKLMQ